MVREKAALLSLLPFLMAAWRAGDGDGAGPSVEAGKHESTGVDDHQQ
jgi:hypothetical protein